MSEPMSLIPELMRLRTFAGASEADLRSLLDATTHRTVERGELLAQAGDPAKHAWLVVRGRLHIEAGAEALQVGEVWPGEMIGEEGVFGLAQTRVTSLRAVQNSLVLELDRTRIDASDLSSNPAMGALQRHMLHVCTRRLNALDLARYRATIAPDITKKSEESYGSVLADRPSSPRAWLQALFGGDR